MTKREKIVMTNWEKSAAYDSYLKRKWDNAAVLKKAVEDGKAEVEKELEKVKAEAEAEIEQAKAEAAAEAVAETEKAKKEEYTRMAHIVQKLKKEGLSDAQIAKVVRWPIAKIKQL